jgi:Na+-driven multidrug efflux pump
VAGLFQPAAGVVFVLDGVLIGAGDAGYLAWASLGCTGVFVAGLALLRAAGGGLVGLWLAIGGFTLARWAALAWRERTDAWLRTG